MCERLPAVHSTVRTICLIHLAVLSLGLLSSASALERYDFTRGVDRAVWQVQGETAVPGAKEGLRLQDGRLEFFQAPGKVRGVARLMRTVQLETLTQVRVHFVLGASLLTGIYVSLSKDKAFYHVGLASDGMLHLSAAYAPGWKPFYAGPRPAANAPFSLRLSVTDKEIRAFFVPLDGLPRPIHAYTRPLPAAWQQGEVNLTIGFTSAKEAKPGAAQLAGVEIYNKGDAMPVDAPCAKTIPEVLAKFHTLRDGRLTPLLASTVKDIKAKYTPAGRTVRDRFTVQAWDAAKIGATRGWTDATVQDIAQYYNLLQFRGSAPTGEFLELLKKHGMELTLYMITRQAHYTEALARSPHVTTTVVIKGKDKQGWLNIFNSDHIELASRCTLQALAPFAKAGVLRRVQLDSEYRIGPGNDALTQAAARADGITDYRQRPDALKPGVLPDSDPAFCNHRWILANSTYCVRHATIARMIHQTWPGVEVTTDPIVDYGRLERFQNLDVIQHWMRVQEAPRDPRGIAYYCERGRVHVRASGGKSRVVIGPQLAHGNHATPADMLSESCWLAVAFGAKGITHWGNQALWQKDGGFAPGGEAAWERMKRLNRDLYRPHEKLILAWTPVPRRLAMLYTERDSWYSTMFRALLSVGEPADVLYHQEVEAGALKHYAVLVVHDLPTASQSLFNAIKAFVARGGTLITTPDSVLEDLPGAKILKADLYPIYASYTMTKNKTLPQEQRSLEADAYAKHLHAISTQVRALLPFDPRIQLDQPDVIANLMTDGRGQYLILVNDKRIASPQAAKPEGPVYMLDQGAEITVRVKLTGLKQARMLHPDRTIPVAEDGTCAVRLEPGWGAILRLERQ